MCESCGCEDNGKSVKYIIPGVKTSDHHHDDGHKHDHNHHHHHDNDRHSHAEKTRINIDTDILGRNNLLAERNRGFFEAKGIFCLNMMSSPGSGKTLLLEKTIKSLIKNQPLAVIEGDQQTANDAQRIKSAGAPVIQVNTGNGCHLDADMINNAVKKLNPENNSILFIENVGNLVCPSLFDLGESKRIVIISTTEGDDKPLKYPVMFENADLCIINKTDLLPYVDFSVLKAREYAKKVNHNLEFIELSAKTGEGIEKWINWLGKDAV